MILPANIQTFPTINVIAFNYHTYSFMKLAKIQVSLKIIIVLYVFVSLVSKCLLVKLCLFYSPALKILSYSIASSVLSIFSISYSVLLSLGSFPFSHSVLVLTLQSPSRNLQPLATLLSLAHLPMEKRSRMGLKLSSWQEKEYRYCISFFQLMTGEKNPEISAERCIRRKNICSKA